MIPPPPDAPNSIRLENVGFCLDYFTPIYGVCFLILCLDFLTSLSKDYSSVVKFFFSFANAKTRSYFSLTS
jgi:hypothetical protein